MLPATTACFVSCKGMAAVAGAVPRCRGFSTNRAPRRDCFSAFPPRAAKLWRLPSSHTNRRRTSTTSSRAPTLSHLRSVSSAAMSSPPAPSPWPPAFTPPPPPVRGAVATFPRRYVLLVTLRRPRQLNALTRDMHAQLAALWAWFDAQPVLRCAVVTGCAEAGAFSVGADLKEWNQPSTASSSASASGLLTHGFGGLSNRRGRKPVVAAVHGACLGGAMEMVLNADLVAATATARFGLPEVGVGVVAVAGGLPRLTRTVGRQRASEMALLGGTRHSAAQMRDWGVVNRVVVADTAEQGHAAVLDVALGWAETIAAKSPDAVAVTREGLLGGWAAEDPAASTRRVGEGPYASIEDRDNMREGIASFVEKRRPMWKDSKL